MTTIHISVQSSLAPERVLEAAHDFSARRAEVWPAVSVARLTVHDRGDTWADVTEGTRAGPVVNWERCRYDWSQPSSVTAAVIDSNVYAVPGSSWEVKTEPSDGGSSVEMIWAREFRSGPRGLLFATAFRLVGKRVFGGYAQQVLDNLERLERTPPGPPDAMPSPSSHHLPNSKPAPRVRHARGARLRCSSRGWALRGGRAALSVLAAAVLVLAGCPSALAAPLGQIAEFPTGLQPSNDSYPFGIAAGADGNMWFTDEGTAKEIGRITPTGQITEFFAGLVPSNDSGPVDIAAGADGNMWFTDEGTTPAIGRIGAGAPAASIAAPSVTGSGQQGTQQACQGDRWSDWAGQQPLLTTIPGYPAYQWSRDGTTIAGANSQSYTPVAGDVGHSLRCTVTVTYALLGTTETATSAAVTVIPQSFGSTGPTGPTGATGRQGPAGKIELVTCNTVRTTVTRKHKRVHVTKQACKTKLVSGPVKFTTASADQRASLSRAAVIYATGYAHRTRVGLQTSLIAARKLARGNRSGGRRAGLKDACWLQGILRLCGVTRSIWCTAVVLMRSRR